MEKALTLKEFKELLVDHASLGSHTRSVLDSVAKSIPVSCQNRALRFDFHKEGKDLSHYVCTECGAEITTSKRYAWSRNSEPICSHTTTSNCLTIYEGSISGKDLCLHSVDRNYFASVVDVNKKQGYALIALFGRVITFISDKAFELCSPGDYSFMRGKFVCSGLNTIMFVLCSKKHGIRYWDGSLRRPDTAVGETLQREFHNATILPNLTAELLDFLETTPEEITGNPKVKDTDIPKLFGDIENAKSVSSTHKKKTDAALSSYMAIPVDTVEYEDLIPEASKPMAILRDSIMGTEKYVYYCPHCNSVSQIENKGSFSDFTCPNCGKTEKRSCVGISRTEQAVVRKTLMRYEEKDKKLVARLFDASQILSLNKTVEGGEIEFNVDEILRFFFTRKEYFGISFCNGTPTKANLKNCFGSRYNGRYYSALCQDENTIKDIVSKTDMNYIGLMEAWGKGTASTAIASTKSLERFGALYNGSYLFRWYTTPCLEQLTKVGLYRIAGEIFSGSPSRLEEDYGLNLKATSIYEILNITKPVFKIARAHDVDLSTLRFIKQVWNEDRSFDSKTYEKLKSSSYVRNYILRILRDHKIPLAKIFAYLDTCWNNQCIPKDEAIRIWSDYLNMAAALRYRMKNKQTKYPSSLKKEHDRAQFAYSAVSRSENKAAFKARATQNARWAYSYGDMLVKVPQEPEEVISEGTELKHCVASYVNAITNGSSIVVFIRRKDDPDEPYFTMEVDDKNYVISQVEGYTRSKPVNKKLIDFIEHYAKAKGLKWEH